MKSTLRTTYAVIFSTATLIVAALIFCPTVPFVDAAHAQITRAQDDAPEPGNTAMDAENNSVSGLPFARGKSFACLADYLAHLEVQSAFDLPYWRQVRPGIYEQVVTMRGREPEVATREELLRRFGFSC